MKAMARQRSHSIEFKRQVAQEFIAGESLYALSKRHDISRQLIRVWVQKYEAGALDEDAQAADLLQEYEAKIAALERMVGRQALEIEFLKGALKNAPRPRSVNTSVIAGPAASPSQKDAGFSNRPSGSSTFRLSTSAVSMSLTGSRFSSDSAPGPFHHGSRRRGGTI
jgi:transposase-like protein